MTDVRELLGANVLSLGMKADEVRRAKAGGIVTYLRVHDVTAADVIGEVAVPGEASEVRLYETPPTLDDAVAAVQALRRAAGSRRVAAFSMADLEERAGSGWGDIRQVIARLTAAGLTDVAELPVDRLDDVCGSIGVLFDTGLHPQRVTVSHPVGDRRLEILERVRAAVECRPTVIRFAPLPRIAPVDKPTTGYDDVRMVALARLALAEVSGPAGPVSIELDWSLYGPKLAQVALTFGADHLDAVAATSDPSLGRRRGTVEDVERNIRAAGFEPKEYRP